MNLLNTLTKKNLILNKKRTIVTIIGIMLSVALITAVFSMYASLIESLKIYETKENGNFHVVYYDLKNEDMDKLKQNRMVESISYTKSMGFAKIDSKNEYKPYVNVVGFNSKALKNLSVKLVSGRLPSNDSEIVIPTHLKTNGRLELHVDDYIELSIGKRYINDHEIETPSFTPYESGEVIKDTITKKYKIVGIIERPAINVETYDSPGYSFITYLDDNNNYDDINVYVRYTKKGLKDNYKVSADILGIKEDTFKLLYSNYKTASEEDLIEAEKDIQHAKYYFNFNMYLIELEVDPLNNSTTGSLVKVVIAVALIIVFTSVFCIKNSFDISITEKIRQYGMLRSMGATKKQIRKNVFYEAFILGTIGIPLGILLGFGATYILILISNLLMNNIAENMSLQFSFSYISVIISLILGIITINLSAIRSAIKASKVTPLESIRNSGEIKIKGNKIKSPKIINKLFGIGGEISYKNLKRNKKKYRTTTLSLIVSVISFISLSYFMSVVTDSIKEEISLTDYNISLSCTSEECQSKMLKTVNFDNIEKYTVLKSATVSLDNYKVNDEVRDKYNETYEYYDDELNKNVQGDNYQNISIVALGNEEYKRYLKELNINYEDAKDKAILVDTFALVDYEASEKTKTRYKIYEYKSKDVIKYSYYNKEDIDKSTGSIEVIKTTDTFPFGLKERLSGMASLGSVIVVSDEYYDKTFEDHSISEILYKSSDANKLQDDIDKYFEGNDIYLRNIDESIKQVENLITLIGIFLYGFITVIILIGITNIFNTITTSVYLRKREFAMLKSIGMTSNEFTKMIRLESLFMGVKSLLYSIPIGLILSYLLYISLGKRMGVLYHFPITSIIISICAVFILIMLIMKYSIGKVNKQNIIETIRNENI